MEQVQSTPPSNENLSIDKSSSLNDAASAAMATPIDAMANGALSSMGIDPNNAALGAQQMQAMGPGLLNFLMNVMPTQGGSPYGGSPYGGFPQMAGPRGGFHSQMVPNSNLNYAVRRAVRQGLNQVHF
jgi:hypothetical protein